MSRSEFGGCREPVARALDTDVNFGHPITSGSLILVAYVSLDVLGESMTDLRDYGGLLLGSRLKRVSEARGG